MTWPRLLLQIIFSSVGCDPYIPEGDIEKDIPAWQRENSMEDLRLPVKVYRLGKAILRAGLIATRRAAYLWLQQELAGRG